MDKVPLPRTRPGGISPHRLAMVCILCNIVLSVPFAAMRPRAAAYDTYINANSWPVDGEFRGITAYPDTKWTWQHLGFVQEQTCPTYYLRGFESSQAVWRDQEVPIEADWDQASQGGRWVACYRGHAGTDIVTLPGAPVYAAADGWIVKVQAHVDEIGEDASIHIRHWRVLDGVKYGWQARYVHLENRFPVTSGMVSEGQLIGFVAERAGNTHLHFEVNDLFECPFGCIHNPWGPTYLWVDDDFDNLPDPATLYLKKPEPGQILRVSVTTGPVRYLPYFFPAHTPILVEVHASNPGDEPRPLSITLGGFRTQDVKRCAFTILPGAEWETFTLSAVTSEVWMQAQLEIVGDTDRVSVMRPLAPGLNSTPCTSSS